jgi:hypothetical protein
MLFMCYSKIRCWCADREHIREGHHFTERHGVLSIPITCPWPFINGPPEFPGFIDASIRKLSAMLEI